MRRRMAGQDVWWLEPGLRSVPILCIFFKHSTIWVALGTDHCWSKKSKWAQPTANQPRASACRCRVVTNFSNRSCGPRSPIVSGCSQSAAVNAGDQLIFLQFDSRTLAMRYSRARANQLGVFQCRVYRRCTTAVCLALCS